MPTYHRHDINRLLAEIKKGEVHPVYLLFGERYLCREAAEAIAGQLLPDEKERDLKLMKIDGDGENVGRTISRLLTYSLFAGRQVFRVLDSKIFYSRLVAKNFWEKAKKAADEANPAKAGRYLLKMLQAAGLGVDEPLTELSSAQWKKLFGFERPDDVAWCAEVAVPVAAGNGGGGADDALLLDALEKGWPSDNILLLTAEAVDKRKKVFKKIEERGAVVDLSVDSGTSTAAQKDRDAVIRDLVITTLRDMGKKAGAGVVDVLLDRVGFHPVAAVRETEKLALFVGEQQIVRQEDVLAIIGQTREEAIFQLNDAVAAADLARAVALVVRLRDSGIHPLALVAGLRNLLRRLLFIRALREKESPRYEPGLSFPLFQKGYLAELKQSTLGTSVLLDGHPYVLFKAFQQAGNFDLTSLRTGLALLLDAEFLLKGSSLPPHIILEDFLFRFLDKTVKSLFPPQSALRTEKKHL
ncbi:MAG: DNA polymerase III subunit delta [Thermodesulfobacteriota bacterium]